MNICKYCKKDIEQGAKKCPHCQSDLRSWARKHPVWTAILSFIGLLILIGLFSNDGGNTATENSTNNTVATETTSSNSPAPQEISVTDSQLIADYTANEIAADEKYKGKFATITGKVDSIGKALGKAYITLDGGNGSNLNDVQCLFSSENESSLATLTKGQSVTVTGTIDGMSINITVRDCKLK